MNAKIRNAQLKKIPYMLIVGDHEVNAGMVSVRLRSGKNLGPMACDAFENLALHAVRTKALSMDGEL